MRHLLKPNRLNNSWSSVQLSKSDESLVERLLDIINMNPNYLIIHTEDSLEVLAEVRDMDMLVVQSLEPF